ENGTNTGDDKEQLQKEISELATEITSTAEKTKFNTLSLINGKAGVQVDSSPAGLGTSGAKIDVSSANASSTYALARNNNELTRTSNGVSQTITVTNAAAVAAGSVLNFDQLVVKITTGSRTDFSQAGNVGNIVTGASQS